MEWKKTHARLHPASVIVCTFAYVRVHTCTCVCVFQSVSQTSHPVVGPVPFRSDGPLLLSGEELNYTGTWRQLNPGHPSSKGLNGTLFLWPLSTEHHKQPGHREGESPLTLRWWRTLVRPSRCRSAGSTTTLRASGVSSSVCAAWPADPIGTHWDRYAWWWRGSGRTVLLCRPAGRKKKWSGSPDWALERATSTITGTRSQLSISPLPRWSIGEPVPYRSALRPPPPSSALTSQLLTEVWTGGEKLQCNAAWLCRFSACVHVVCAGWSGDQHQIIRM